MLRSARSKLLVCLAVVFLTSLVAVSSASASTLAITSPNFVNTSVGAKFVFRVTITGSTTAEVTATGALPTGVKFHKGKGKAKISGKPSKKVGVIDGSPAVLSPGDYHLTITATSGTGASAQVVHQQFLLWVYDGSLAVSPRTGITADQVVTVTGNGFEGNSPGLLLECNNDPTQPLVNLGPPVEASIPVGCSEPVYSSAVVTGPGGTLSTTYTIASGTVGPPCGPGSLATCPATDTAGVSPATDAANYPCPPTPAQEAAGITCALNWGDEYNDLQVAPFLFSGE